MKLYTTPDPQNDELQLFAVDESGVRHSFRGYIVEMRLETERDDFGGMFAPRSFTASFEVQVTGEVVRTKIPEHQTTTEVAREPRELPWSWELPS